MSIVNIAAYKFVRLDELKRLRQELQRLCRRARLRGTILLAPEGVNLFVAGARSATDRLLDFLQGDPRIGLLDVKESLTEYEPFRRMLVKIKREIIAFGVDAVDPTTYSPKKISPQQLCQWLDEGKELALLDTRNNYEIKLGTFAGAHACDIDHFRDFPAAARNLPDSWRSRPLVMFCTGGIRCEKAGPWLERLGFAEVHQLDGGILNYFHKVGRRHYEGDCFVFDQRVAVDAALRETCAAQCYACQAILTPEEQLSPHYAPGVSCPFCYRTPDQRLAETLEERGRQLGVRSTPLPGCIPYENVRPIYVPARCAGWRVVDFLVETAAGFGRRQWEAAIVEGRLLCEQTPVVADRIVCPGERYEHVVRAVVEPEVNANVRFLYEDAALVVVDKPAPLPMHPCGRYNKNTLASLLAPLYLPQRLRNAHRLDANTTGAAVYTRSQRMARILQSQFQDGKVKKVYLARVWGRPAEREFACSAAIASQAGRAGARSIEPAGLASHTHFCRLREYADGTTLLVATPGTGRTNQIRLHLESLNLPILGDPMYRGGATQGGATHAGWLEGGESPDQAPWGGGFGGPTLSINDPPMCLHAWKIGFKHPATGGEVEFVAPPPSWSVEE